MNGRYPIWQQLLAVFAVTGFLPTLPIAASLLGAPSGVTVGMSIFLASGTFGTIAFLYARCAPCRARRLAAFLLISGGLATVSKVAAGVELAIVVAADFSAGVAEFPFLLRLAVATPWQVDLTMVAVAFGMFAIAYRLLSLSPTARDGIPPLYLWGMWRERAARQTCLTNSDCSVLDRMFRRIVSVDQ